MRRDGNHRGPGSRRRRGGFTLVELLVVIFIILLVSAATLPVVLPALNHRQASEAARLLQGAIVGAQDAAVHANAPRGIRLMPDPTFPLQRYAPTDPIRPNQLIQTTILAANRIVPLEAAPDYSEGKLTPYRSYADALFVGFDPIAIYGGGGGVVGAPAPALVVEEALYDNNAARNNPTSWFWNVRVGDKIRIGKSGWLYTVTGPMVIGPADGNVELFVNIGYPGKEVAACILSAGMEMVAVNPANPVRKVYPDPTAMPNLWAQPREYLFLVNGRDDTANGLPGAGFIDEGRDGLDNDLDGNTDEADEWEVERWVGGVASAIEAEGAPMSLPYTIVRRPVPSSSARETALPADMVVDLTTWGYEQSERSRLPIDPYTGYVDIMFSPNGEVIPTTIYSTPANSPMGDAFYHFWLAERQDLHTPDVYSVAAGYLPPYLPITQGLITGAANALKGEQRIVTLFTRTGQTVTNPSATFDTVNAPNTASYQPSRPFISAQQGARGGQ